MPIVGIIHSSRRVPPDAPTIVSATDSGALGANGRAFNNGAVTVTFTAPAYNGGLPITSYRVTASTGQYQDGAASPITVTGLGSSTTPTFTVTATNAAGTSSPSGQTAQVTVTTVPEAPTIGSASAGNGQATVTYTAGGSGGKTVTQYTATSSPSSITGNGASPITVSPLSNGTPYSFTVTATNGNGTSLASGPSNQVTPFVPPVPAPTPQPTPQAPTPQPTPQPVPQAPVAPQPTPQAPVAPQPTPQAPVAPQPTPQAPVAPQPTPQAPVYVCNSRSAAICTGPDVANNCCYPYTSGVFAGCGGSGPTSFSC